jgi:orotidine-5'-phosphate decarboxylase
MHLFSDRLLDAMQAKGAPICVGIDPILDLMPPSLVDSYRRNGRLEGQASVDLIFDFTTRILKVISPLVGVVKFQSAYFEQFLWEGVEAYYMLVQEASERGLIAIGDIKRGDIGSTVSAYAAGIWPSRWAARAMSSPRPTRLP